MSKYQEDLEKAWNEFINELIKDLHFCEILDWCENKLNKLFKEKK